MIFVLRENSFFLPLIVLVCLFQISVLTSERRKSTVCAVKWSGPTAVPGHPRSMILVAIEALIGLWRYVDLLVEMRIANFSYLLSF